MEAGMRAPPRRTPREFYGSTVMHVAPALEYPGEDPVLRPIHPWMAVGSSALALLCVATRAVICFATEKTSEIKLFRTPTLAFSCAPLLLATLLTLRDYTGSFSGRIIGLRVPQCQDSQTN